MKGFFPIAEYLTPSQKLNNKVKTLILSDEVQCELNQTEHILITHAFNEVTTGLKEFSGIRTIYCVYIKVRNKKVPLNLIKVLDRYTTPQTVFEVDDGEGYTYVMALKKAKPRRMGEYHQVHSPTEWYFIPNPKFKDMADLYSTFIALVQNIKKQEAEELIKIWLEAK